MSGTTSLDFKAKVNRRSLGTDVAINAWNIAKNIFRLVHPARLSRPRVNSASVDFNPRESTASFVTEAAREMKGREISKLRVEESFSSSRRDDESISS